MGELYECEAACSPTGWDNSPARFPIEHLPYAHGGTLVGDLFGVDVIQLSSIPYKLNLESTISCALLSFVN